MGPVYRISCQDCEASCVGETERSLKVKFGEHRSSVNFEISEHIHQEEPGHSVELTNSQVVTVEPVV